GRAGGRAGVHRSAHALRRADLLGRRDDAIVVARGDVGGDGELRGGDCAVPAAGTRGRDAGSRERGGDSVRGAGRGHYLGLGDVPAVHGGGAAPQAGAQSRVPRAANAVQALRDGRGVDGAGGERGGNRKNKILVG